MLAMVALEERTTAGGYGQWPDLLVEEQPCLNYVQDGDLNEVSLIMLYSHRDLL